MCIPPALVDFFTNQDGVIGCMPKGMDSIAVACSKVMFEKYGVELPNGDWTWDDMLSVCASLKDKMDGAGDDACPMALELNSIKCSWGHIMFQFGGSLFEDGKCTFNTPENVNAFKGITDMIDKGYIPDYTVVSDTSAEDLYISELLCESEAEAAVLAQEAVDLNNSRKLLTEQAVEVAKQMIADGGYENDRVFVIFLPDCHESLAGIVAGRIREAYHRPTLVITRGEEGAKGSGRSIEGYSMFEELNKCADLLSSFGGHPMAAGFSLPEENIEAFRRRLNEVCTLTEEELQAKVVIDVPMPIGYITFPLIEQLKLLEPFGKGNDKPVFADRNLVIERLKIYGPTGRVVQLTLHSSSGAKVQAVYFGDPDNLRLPLEEKYGKVVADDTMANRCVHNAALHFTYYPEIDTYYETPRVKLKITGISA